MIPVYICEDHESSREYITKQIQNLIIIENLDMEVALSTGNPITLLEEFFQNKERGIYFLDVDLSHELNGFDVAKEIRKKDPRGFIIFVTTHGELAFDTFKYQLEAMDYILKDEPEKIGDRIHTALINIHKRMEEDNTKDADYFVVKLMDELKYIKINDIIYFETSNVKHKVILVTEDTYFEFFSNLKVIEEKVGQQFIRCHRSFLINKSHIDTVSIKDSMVIMKNGKQCDISRSGRKRMEERLIT